MPNLFLAFISQFFIFVFTLLLIYAIGVIYFKYYIKRESLLQKSNLFLSFAEKSVFGVSILALTIAVIKTGAETVHSISLLLLLLFPLLLKWEKSKIVSPYKQIKINKSYFNYFFIGLISFLVYCFHFFFGFHPDHLFYAKLSSAIYTNGIENISALYIDYQIPSGISLYHYTELWLNGLISTVFSQNSLFSLIYIVYPLFHLMGFIIILGILYEIYERFLKSFIVAFAILYGSALLFYVILTPAQGHNISWFYGLPDITAFKSIIIYPFLFLSLYYLEKNCWSGFIIMLSLCCINYISVVFAMVGGIIPIGVYYLFHSKKSTESRKKIIFIILLFICILLIFIFRFAMNTNFSYETANRNAIHIIKPLKEYFSDFQIYLNIFFNYFLRPFYLYPIVTLGFIYLLFRNIILSKKIGIYIISCFVAGAAFVSLFFALYNVTQAMSMIIPPLMTFLSIFVLKSLPNTKQIVYAIILFVFSILNMNKVNDFDLEKYKLTPFELKLVEFAENNLKNKKTAFYAERSQYRWIYNGQIVSCPLFISSQTKFPIEITPCFEKNFKKYCLDNPDYPLRHVQAISDTNITSIINYLKNKEIEFVYIKNSKTANKSFLQQFKPIIVEKEQGLWQLI